MSRTATSSRPESYGLKPWSFPVSMLTGCGQAAEWRSVLMQSPVDGVITVKATEFNQRWKPGSIFIYQPSPVLRGGRLVKTVDVARDFKEVTVVEINQEPYFANIKSLKPAN